MSISRNTTSTRIALFSKQLFSVGDAAAYLGMSTSTVRRRIAAGALRAQRWGRGWMLWRDDLDWYCRRVTSTDGKTPRPISSASPG